MTCITPMKHNLFISCFEFFIMCGIFAYYGMNEIDETKCSYLIDTFDKITHRGPDDTEYTIANEKYFFGHKRLSIIDLSENGKQPMCDAARSLMIIFNGEVYNYKEIKLELSKIDKNIKFKSETDTEVILYAYKYWGVEMLKKLNGQFAFLIYDKTLGETFIARDRFGIKPIYYTKTNENEIIFSSEIKSILPLKSKIEPNTKIIYDYITLSRTDHTDETFFKDVYRFPAGHYLLIKDDELQNSFNFIKWWDLNEEIKKMKIKSASKSFEQEMIIIKKLISKSIELRLRSDVAVGSCLSGGIDSTCIVGKSINLLDGEMEFNTFSAVYGDWYEYNESKFIDIVNEKYKSKSHKVYPNIDYFNKFFDNFVYHQEEPVPSASPFSQFLVMFRANQVKQKVLLDGQGADEIFGGYEYMQGYVLSEYFFNLKIYKFFNEIFKTLLNKNFSAIKVFLYQLLPPVFGKIIYKNKNLFKDEIRKENSNNETYKLGIYKSRSLNDALAMHVEYKLQHLLKWEDKNSMAYSIECRVPFLDHNLVVKSLSLPSDYKINKGNRKFILKKSMDKNIPDEILNRKTKIGFAAPDDEWINDPKNKFTNELLYNPHKLMLELFEMVKVHNLFKSNKNEKWLKFKLVNLDVWFKTFFD